jgi:acyl-CoA synthetase (AMP-forming)/AMP-acid ligase II
MSLMTHQISPFDFDPYNSTLIDILRRQVESRPDREAFTFLENGKDETLRLNLGEIDLRSRGLAAALRERAAPGDRALLLLSPGLNYPIAFFGSAYAGVVPVLAFPPVNETAVQALFAITVDSGARLVLTDARLLRHFRAVLDALPGRDQLSIVNVDALENEALEPGQAGRPRPEDLALITYTSGSTQAPKGVMLSHRNLAYFPLALMQKYADLIPRHQAAVSWAPQYHIGGFLSILPPLVADLRSILIPTQVILERPLLWLQAMSRYRAGQSGGFNFAYRLCLTNITPEERLDLDLSSWEIAYSGGEAIDTDLMERFAAAYAPCGFSAQAFAPQYGLSETGGYVCGGLSEQGLNQLTVDAQALAQNRVELVSPPGSQPVAQVVTLAGQMLVLEGTEVRIVDPDSRQALAPDRVGEIWVKGPSVGLGYWNKPEITEASFQARLEPGGEGSFLRTGDMGFIRAGKLYVTGRMKDVIILRGRNYYAPDIERAVTGCHPALVEGGVAAVGVRLDGEESLAILHEVHPLASGSSPDAVTDAIRLAVAERRQLPVAQVVLVQENSLPRTLTRKIQRAAALAALQSEALQVEFESRSVAGQDEASPDADSDEQLPFNPLEAALQGLWTSILNVRKVGAEDNFFALGGNSLQATQLLVHVAEVFGVDVTMPEFYARPTIVFLAERIRFSRQVQEEFSIPNE